MKYIYNKYTVIKKAKYTSYAAGEQKNFLLKPKAESRSVKSQTIHFPSMSQPALTESSSLV